MYYRAEDGSCRVLRIETLSFRLFPVSRPLQKIPLVSEILNCLSLVILNLAIDMPPSRILNGGERGLPQVYVAVNCAYSLCMYVAIVGLFVHIDACCHILFAHLYPSPLSVCLLLSDLSSVLFRLPQGQTQSEDQD